MANSVTWEPYEACPLAEKIQEQMTANKHGISIYNPGKVSLDSTFKKLANVIPEYEVREDDVWLITYPKSGTTWMQELVWLIGNDLDYEAASESSIFARFPFIELGALWDISEMDAVNAPPLPEEFIRPHELAQNIDEDETRFIKSHLPKQFLPKQLWTKKPKIIYVARHPKDVCVSYYHHFKMFEGFTGNFEDFFEYFINDIAMYSPYWPHVLEFWKMRNEENVLFVSYEDMKSDLHEVIRRVADFMDEDLEPSEVTELAQHLTLERMRENPTVNYHFLTTYMSEVGLNQNPDGNFMRKGKTGDWKNHFSTEMNSRFDAWVEENIRGTDYMLPEQTKKKKKEKE